MKKLLVVVVLVCAAAIVAPGQDKATKNEIVCYKSSMDCSSCENTIFETLRFEKGVKEVKTDLSSNTIKVVFDRRKNNREALAKVIQEKGYKADVITEDEYIKLVTPGKGSK
jgi:mercuric ion binding protein